MAMLTYVLKNVNVLKTEELAGVTSNLLVTNRYWMVAFKIHVFAASLFEEAPNRDLGIMNVFFSTLKVFQECLLFM